MALNIINFSNGIRPEEIQDNFNYLQEQIERERISIGGAGIASGLDITVNVTNELFNIEISDGSIVNEKGEEIFIKGCVKEVPPPELIPMRETLTLSEDKTVTLKHKPYALNQRMPAEFLNSYVPELSGINIKYKNSLNIDDYIRVRGIENRTVTVSGAINKELEVSYHYTAKRIDMIYVDENLEIQRRSCGSTTSTTPSIPPTMNYDEVKFLIAYLEINNEYSNEEDPVPHAYMYVKNDLRSIRNLYTSKDGELYICGVPFDDLQIIHLKEPTEPKEFTLWLNLTDNTLYCWRSTDEFTYKNKIDVTTDFVENAAANQNFSTYMDFTLGEGELSVYLNNCKLTLGRDYEEISKKLPTVEGNVGDKERGNAFRILQSMIRIDIEDESEREKYQGKLMPGDVLIYTIKYKDSQFMWVPVNKQNYLTVKNSRVYCTYYDGIKDEYLYDKNIAYFDSDLANSLDPKDPVTGMIPKGHYPYKYQYFLFDRIKDMDMLFTPGRKELSIMINQMPLHEDQFKEIQINDLLEENDIPISVKAAARDRFGWTEKYISDNTPKVDGEYFGNAGIGFMLINPLDSGVNADTANNKYDIIGGSNDIFVEVTVEHRVCSTPMNRKLERSATFVSEDFIVIEENFDGIIEVDGQYRFDDHQLEVYVDGIKQTLGVDYIEQFGYFNKDKNGNIFNEDKPIDEDEEYDDDQSYFMRKKSAVCTKFKFKKEVNEGSVVEYRITTNVYSYDHINNILDTMVDDMKFLQEIVKENTDNMLDFKEEIKNEVETIKEKVNEIVSFDDEYVTYDSILNLSQMPNMVLSNMIKSLKHINIAIELETGKEEYTISGIWPEDYLNIFYHSDVRNSDSYWVPGLHYELRRNGTEGSVLKVKQNTDFDVEDVLYISGLKLSPMHEFEASQDVIYHVTEEQVKDIIDEMLADEIIDEIIDEEQIKDYIDEVLNEEQIGRDHITEDDMKNHEEQMKNYINEILNNSSITTGTGYICVTEQEFYKLTEEERQSKDKLFIITEYNDDSHPDFDYDYLTNETKNKSGDGDINE